MRADYIVFIKAIFSYWLGLECPELQICFLKCLKHDGSSVALILINVERSDCRFLQKQRLREILNAIDRVFYLSLTFAVNF